MKVSDLSKFGKSKKNSAEVSSLDDVVVLQESKVMVCSNDACGRNIAEPIKVENFSVSPMESYYACPHCLSKVDTVLD